ncbi:hypothetical protein RB598_005462 [Gaeumannomyces tritici]
MPDQIKKEPTDTTGLKCPAGGAGRQSPGVKQEDPKDQAPKRPQSQAVKKIKVVRKKKKEEGNTKEPNDPQSEAGQKSQVLEQSGNQPPTTTLENSNMPTGNPDKEAGKALPAQNQIEGAKIPASAASAAPDGDGARQLPALAKMTPEVRDELLKILRQTDRALCLHCLHDYREHPERICTFRSGNQRCDGCAYRGVYCLKLLVTEKRPCFRAIQKLAYEITEHRIHKEGVPISRQVMDAYDTALDAALSFADAVKDIKDLKEDRDKLAATLVRLLQLGDDCDSEEEALQWANKCGWELANLRRDDHAAAMRGGLVPGSSLSLTDNLIKSFVDLREVTSKRWQAEDKNIRTMKQLEDTKTEVEELKRAKKRAEDARDNVVSELGNCKAAILAAETALERSKLEYAASMETMRVSNAVALRSPFPAAGQHSQHRQHSLAPSTTDVTMANNLGPSDIHRLPGSVKALLFKHIVAGLPSLGKSIVQRRVPGTKVNREAMELYYLGKPMDFRSSPAMLHYLYNNRLSMQLPGVKYQWSRGDHSHMLNLALTCREVMVRVVQTQALFYKGLGSASNGLKRQPRLGAKRPAAGALARPMPPARVPEWHLSPPSQHGNESAGSQGGQSANKRQRQA